MSCEFLNLEEKNLVWHTINLNFQTTVKACNFMFQNTEDEVLMFGGWF